MTGSVQDFGQSKELHEYGMKNGAPPIAAKTALIDFDATIRKWGPLMSDDMEPEAGAIEALKELQDRGYNIIIFTSRMSVKWVRSVLNHDHPEKADPYAVSRFLEEQYEFVRTYLYNYGIIPAGITAEKVPSEFYIDDRAIGYRGDWGEVLSDSLIK